MLGVLGAIYYFALHMSLAEEIENEAQRADTLRAQMVEAQNRQQEYLRLTQELAARGPIDDRNKQVLPEQPEIAAFLQDLNRLAELSGLAILLVEPRPEEPAERYIRIPVTLRLRGRYHQLAKFFFNVGKLERVVNMENLHLREPTTAAGDIVLEIGVLATAFRRTGPAGEAPQPTGGAR
jgi:type IV pilus assembly protein PilO